ncbi:MAG TPA: hypothetical protein PKJ32_11825 [Piscinibacter sp.]|nr:hypothetical protein [Piscinibacter sp.]
MPAPTPIRAHRTHHPALQSIGLAGRLMLQIVGIGLRGLLFAGAHRLLPPAIRVISPGFLACSALFFVAAWLRHGLAGQEHGVQVMWGAGLAYAALMLVSLSQRMSECTLCLCISVAADLLAVALERVGVPSMGSEPMRTVLLVWPLAAVFVALVQLRLARAVRPTPPAA